MDCGPWLALLRRSQQLPWKSGVWPHKTPMIEQFAASKSQTPESARVANGNAATNPLKSQ
jgi:hypothetical protein